ncbi:MAG: ribosome-associated translation inhibitor RaiA [Acidobacteriota bacterium]|nr:ribosome-associated translation inhibitor RaiA [Acidobacteriota bacterium]
MNIEYVGKHFDLNEAIKDFCATRLDKVARFVDEPVEVRITLEQEKNRFHADLHLSHRFGVLQSAEDSQSSMQDAVSLAADKLEKQARRSRKKFLDRRRRADRVVQDGHRWPVEVLDRESVSAGSTPRIIESTHLPIKPMTLDEAALELDAAKMSFVVFRDSGNNEVSVLYKRSDENYGLIVPGRQ